MVLEIGKLYNLFILDEEGERVKVSAEYVGVNDNYEEVFRINDRIKSFEEGTFAIQTEDDTLTVGQLIDFLKRYPANKLVSVEMDDENGINLMSIPGGKIDFTEEQDVLILTPNKVVTQDY